jgi:hypothetical protein
MGKAYSQNADWEGTFASSSKLPQHIQNKRVFTCRHPQLVDSGYAKKWKEAVTVCSILATRSSCRTKMACQEKKQCTLSKPSFRHVNCVSISLSSGALFYKPEGRRFDSQWPWIFNRSSRNMALGSTESLTEMSTRNLSGGKGRPARKADLISICEPVV